MQNLLTFTTTSTNSYCGAIRLMFCLKLAKGLSEAGLELFVVRTKKPGSGFCYQILIIDTSLENGPRFGKFTK